MLTTISTRNLIAVLVMIAALLTAITLPATAADAGREGDFLEQLNHERTSRGLASLKLNTQLRSVARSWSNVMERDDKLKHNPNLASDVTEEWTRLGENVGVGYGVSSLHDAFMNSSGHRANILGDYNQVGIGVTMDGSRIWVTVVFMKGPASANTITSASSTWSFSDISGTHAPNIEKIAAEQISLGCGGDRFCPNDRVTRAQMATFLARALDLAATSSNRFQDVSGTHATNINAIAEAGISTGCGTARYCPSDYVTRAQMATFLARALDLPASSANQFSDVSGTHAKNINAIAEAGISAGCGSGTYCPSDYVTRAQMATFLARALDL